MTALEDRVASLELLLQKVAKASDYDRYKLLSDYGAKPPQSSHGPRSPLGQYGKQVHTPTQSETISERRQDSRPQQTSPSTNSHPTTSPTDSADLVLARAREGRICRLSSRKATRFYGGTSLYQMSLSDPSSTGRQKSDRHQQFPAITPGADALPSSSPNSTNEHVSALPCGPRDQLCLDLMAMFFQNVYQYNMCVYREYFLRDFDAGGGPYYSDTLMYAICAMGALVSPDPATRTLASGFASIASAMVYESLELPDLTVLQSLVILGHFEIGQGRSSKGWLFCGMACRLTHEMGLHLDPNNWTSPKCESSIDREILRRVYWAVFVADKQLSLYFGRPPALYPHEADVNSTIRIPYPPEWQNLLDTYISKGISATAFEDGISMIGTVVHQVELAKIFHSMIVEVFENRRKQPDAAVAVETVQELHAALMRWLSSLPQKLQWNQLTVGAIPPYVLHLHMLFHTGVIILHRPPRQHLDDEAVINGEGVEVCQQSLGAILRLISSYGRYYRYEVLPLDFVHTLSAAAEVVMIKRYMEKSSWEDKDISKPMEQVLQVMERVQITFPCMREIRDGILESMKTEATGDGSHQDEFAIDFELMDLLQSGGGPFPPALYSEEADDGTTDVDLGFLVTDDFLNEHFQ